MIVQMAAYQPYRTPQRRKMGFFGAMFGAGSRFADLPQDYRSFILSQRPEHPSETESLVQNPDGLPKIANFAERWNQVVSISREVDQIRSDPAAAALNSREQGLANNLLNGLLAARSYYPYDGFFIRTPATHASLNAALASIDRGLSQYASEVSGLLASAKQAIKDREASQARAAQAAIDAQAAESERIAKESLDRANTAARHAQEELLLKAQAQSETYEAQTTGLTQQIAYEKLVKKANAPKFLGLPLGIAIPGALAVLGTGLFFVLRRKA